jgi:Anti-sigma-K factor rskA
MTMNPRNVPSNEEGPVPHPDLGGFVLGNLTPEEDDRFRAALVEDPDLRREADELGDLPRLLGLAALIDDENDDIALPARVAPIASPKVARSLRLGPLLAAAAAIVLLLGVGTFFASRNRPGGADRQVAFSLVDGSPSTGARGNAKLFRQQGGVGVQLSLTGLEPTAAGNRYECWWVGKNGKVSAGSFQVGPSGTANVRLNVAGSLDSTFRININKVTGTTETRVLTAEAT